MSLHALAGKPVPEEMLPDIPRIMNAYYVIQPDSSVPDQQVVFGTSGHRGKSLDGSFNDAHIAAITQAVCEQRAARGITGPLFLGKDTHALSEAAFTTALEVLAGNGVDVYIQQGGGFTPTPVISHAILTYNASGKANGIADGIVITPSHNPPDNGGIKYNPPSGGPADTGITAQIAQRANILMQKGLNEVKRISYTRALKAETTHSYDYVSAYISDLCNVLQMDRIAAAGLRICADGMGGSGAAYWAPLAEKYKIEMDLRNIQPDPTFRFMCVDKDGKIRMDCSSPYAMAGLIDLKDGYDIAFGNDPDYDRHGIVTGSAGLLNPNHYLAVAIDYLFRNRTGWSASAAVGKTLVSSSIIDRIASGMKRTLVEVPVGFKYFVSGLLDGSLGFGGEESAGASFLRTDGRVWSTDKDGIIMSLLAAEIMAVTGKDPGDYYRELTAEYGAPVYERLDVSADPLQRKVLAGMSPDSVTAKELAGELIDSKITRAPGNNEPFGGLKVSTANGWFAARPSGTENIYKIYAESFNGKGHLARLIDEARGIVAASFEAAGATNG